MIPFMAVLLAASAHAAPIFLGGLPETKRAVYEAAVVPALEAAKARMTFSEKKVKAGGTIVVAPVIYETALEEVNAPPPLWGHFSSNGFQKVADWTNYRIVDALRARGLTVLTPDAIGLQGDKPRRPVEGRNFATNKPIPVAVYSTQELREWTGSHYERIREKAPRLGAVIFVRVHNTWVYEGHSKFEGEVMVNYKVPHAIDVWVCTGASDCARAEAWSGGAGTLLKPIPLKVAYDKKQQAVVDDWAANYSAQFHASMALAGIDKVATFDGPAPAPVFAPVKPRAGARLVSKLHGKCAAAKEGKLEQGVELEMRPCDKKSAAQKFDRTAAAELKAGGLCVSSYGAEGKNGDKLVLWACSGTANQKWQDRAPGLLEGMNGRCAAISGADKNDGAPLLLWDCGESHLHEAWALE